VTIVQNVLLRSLAARRYTAPMPHTGRSDAYFLMPMRPNLTQLRVVENAKKKSRAKRLLFSTGSRVLQTLDPSIKRYAHAVRSSP
jgi:hypothetical protein